MTHSWHFILLRINCLPMKLALFILSSPFGRLKSFCFIRLGKSMVLWLICILGNRSDFPLWLLFWLSGYLTNQNETKNPNNQFYTLATELNCCISYWTVYGNFSHCFSSSSGDVRIKLTSAALKEEYVSLSVLWQLTEGRIYWDPTVSVGESITIIAGSVVPGRQAWWRNSLHSYLQVKDRER